MTVKLQIRAYKEGWDVIYEDAKYAESHHAEYADALAAGIKKARQDHRTLVILDRDGRLLLEQSFADAVPV